jgi:hypothetical protein
MIVFIATLLTMLLDVMSTYAIISTEMGNFFTAFWTVTNPSIVIVLKNTFRKV